VTYKHDRSVTSSNIWAVIDVAKKRTGKVVDVKDAILPFSPVCIISESMNTDMFEVWISRQPLFWPIMKWVTALAPRFPRASTESMNEDEINEGLRRRMKKRKAERSLQGAHLRYID
jgi:hypothetical protein